MQGYNEMGKKKNIENGNTSNKKCSTQRNKQKMFIASILLRPQKLKYRQN